MLFPQILRRLVVVFAFVLLVLTPVFAQEESEIFDNDNTVAEMNNGGVDGFAGEESLDLGASGKGADVYSADMGADDDAVDLDDLNYDGEGVLDEEENIDDILNAEIDDEEDMKSDNDAELEYEGDDDDAVSLNLKSLRLTAHALTNIPEQSEDITVSFKFLDEKMALGKPIRVVVNLKNTGMSVFNVTECMGSLNDVRNFGVFYQNFTERNFNATLYPGYELNFMYIFGIFNNLDPRDYQVALTVFYETDTDFYATTFFNETVRVVDDETIWDIRTLSIIIIFSAAIYFAISYFNKSKAPKKPAKKVDSKEWLEPEKPTKKDSKKKDE